jgi:dTDP-4-dehydrorhamnose 3,5-epimerase
MKVTPTALPEVLLIEPRVFSDERGFFFESYHSQRYESLGIPARFVQDNQSHSNRGVLRGMHYQLGQPQAKLVTVVAGEVYDVAVDIRRGSPTFGRWVGAVLSGENKLQLYIPEGFAHGFYTLSGTADLFYKCADFYAHKEERGVRWDDPDIGIVWPAGERILAPRDAAFPRLREMDADLPLYRP